MKWKWLAYLRWRETLIQVQKWDGSCWLWYPKSWYYNRDFVTALKTKTPFVGGK